MKFYNMDVIKKHIPSFTERDGQENLMDAIGDAIKDGNIVIAEAETGIGKSFSALFPAIYDAMKSGNHHIIYSTNNKILQNQIFVKDIPITTKIINDTILAEGYTPHPFTYDIILGRSNYICKLKLEKYLKESRVSDFNKEQQKEYLKIKRDSEQIMEDHNPLFEKYHIFSEVTSELNCVMSDKKCSSCPYVSCHYNSEHEESLFHRNSLSVTNHDVIFSRFKAINKANIEKEVKEKLLADLLRDAIVIFDEAHKLEDVFHSLFDEKVNIHRIYVKIMNEFDDPQGNLNLFVTSGAISKKDLDSIKEIAYENYQKIKNFDFRPYNGIKNADMMENASVIKLIRIATNDFKNVLGLYKKAILSFMKSETPFSAFAKDYNEYNSVCEIISLFEPTRYLVLKEIVYLSVSQNGDVVLNYNIYEVNKVALEMFLSSAKCIIFMSATLSNNDSFNYFSNMFGFENPNLYKKFSKDYIKCKSPFDFENNMKVMCLDSSGGNEDIPLLVSSLDTIESGALLLFNSIAKMYEYYEAIGPVFKNKKTVLAQYENTRNEILEKAKEENCIIFACQSFFEGIDLQKERLRFLYLNKLPFDNPSDIFIESKREMLDKKGVNGYMELYIPRATKRYKQIIGRLIRTEEDHGVIIVNDERIFTKRYGINFINETPVEIVRYPKKDTQLIKEILKDFGI